MKFNTFLFDQSRFRNIVPSPKFDGFATLYTFPAQIMTNGVNKTIGFIYRQILYVTNKVDKINYIDN